MSIDSKAAHVAGHVRLALMRRGVIMGDDDAAAVRTTIASELERLALADNPTLPDPEPVDPDAPTERIPTPPPVDPDRVKRKG